MLDLLTGKPVWKVNDPYFSAVVFSDDGTIILSFASDFSMKLWNASDGTQRGTLSSDGVPGFLSNVVMLANGKEAIAGVGLQLPSRWTNLKTLVLGYPVDLAAGAVVAWNTGTGQMRTIIDDPLPILAVAANKSGTCLATGHCNGTVHLWHVRSREPAAKRCGDVYDEVSPDSRPFRDQR